MSRPSRFEPKEGAGRMQGNSAAQDHHEWAARMWRRMDRDGSGFITRQELDCEEFRSVLRKVMAPSTGSCMGGPSYARAQMNMDQAVYFFLRKADINSDKSISFEEFKSFMYVLRHSHGAPHTADMIFALFDLNTDNKIEEKEFHEIYRFFLGHDPTEEEFQAEWALLDADGTGFVTRDQYITWLQESENPIFRVHGPPVDDIEVDRIGSAYSEDPSGSDLSELRRDSDGWRPWHNYRHFCWHEPTRGKPSHCKMKFRDTSPVGGGSRSSSGSQAVPVPSLAPLSGNVRPQWNPYLSGAHPNWPDKEGRSRQVVTKRKLFSRPQSLPELQRHLDSRPGHLPLREAMFSTEPRRRKQVLLSHEHSGGAAQVLSLTGRGKPGGSMRHPQTRERKAWDDHWQTPFQLADFYHPGPSTNIGRPPKHLYADLYEEEA